MIITSSLRVFETKKSFSDWREKTEGVVGFVPTMGALHEGHLSLMRRMKEECDLSVVSIFVNPLQFSQGEDLERYPRTLSEDLKKCRELGIDAVFLPSEEEMYREKPLITVDPGEKGKILCGRDRPSHFRGVLTVVTKLFHIVRPHKAYFGEKDFQQLVLIQRMVKDLDFRVEIVPCETIREPDGLAMSSRNRYLSGRERQLAPEIYRALVKAQRAFREGLDSVSKLTEIVQNHLKKYPEFKIIYIKIVSSEDLSVREKTAQKGDRLCIAVRLGMARLIDNIRLGREE